jgi:hypothetical protein
MWVRFDKKAGLWVKQAKVLLFVIHPLLILPARGGFGAYRKPISPKEGEHAPGLQRQLHRTRCWKGRHALGAFAIT